MLISKALVSVFVHLIARASADDDFFYKSHDLSSIGMLEKDQGVVFYDTAKKERPLEDIYRDGGANAVKLRLFVDPPGGVYGLNYTIELAKRFVIKAKFRFILNMHLADSWADPFKQPTPEKWGTNVDEIVKKVRKYVSETLETFCEAGVTPNVVTMGNEVSRGMLFPYGQFDPWEEPTEKRSESMKPFAKLWKSAREGIDDAVKSGKCKNKPDVVLQLDAGWDTRLYEHVFSGLFGTKIVTPADVDVFGLTNFPYYGTQGTFANLENTMYMLNKNWPGKKFHLLETDYPVKCPLVSSEPIEYSPKGQIQWVQGYIDLMKKLPKGAGQGVSYWEGAFLNHTTLGNGGCDDLLLFDVDRSKTKPMLKGRARESVNMFLEKK